MDVKTLLDPVAYVAFDGLNSSRGTRRILLLDPPAADRARDRVQQSLAGAIRSGNLGWTTVRIDREGRAVPEERR